jgi:hypothetical protein
MFAMPGTGSVEAADGDGGISGCMPWWGECIGIPACGG